MVSSIISQAFHSDVHAQLISLTKSLMYWVYTISHISILANACVGTPEERVIQSISSEKVRRPCLFRSPSHLNQAQAYVRTLPIKKRVPFMKLMPAADSQGNIQSVPALIGEYFLQLSIFSQKCSPLIQLSGSQ